nr:MULTISPECIES: PaaI family thioesterase [unclassified Pseudactinotalea]
MRDEGYSLEGTLIERMGIELTELGAGRCTARMPVAGNTQPAGLLHGGASAALAETVGSFAAMLHGGPGRLAVGIELSASHHRSAREGWVVATAEARHLGRTLAVYAVEVRTEEGDRLLCSARLTCLIREA